ncbi:Helitron helicase, partial [Phytophthora megakarya]
MYMESIPQFSDFADVETELDITERNRNRLIEDETSYDPTVLDRQAAGYSTLNNDQLQVFNKIMEAVIPVESHSSTPHLSGKQFFIYGPGGTGKSFLLELILASVRRTSRIVLAVAGSGIAAQLLTGGRTAHSTFRLPLDPNETSTYNFGVRSSQAGLLKKTSLIVWVEAPMTHRYQYDAVDRTLMDLLKNDLPFGGITMVLSGDFRQTLPVIPRAGPAEIISTSIKRSVLNLNNKEGLSNGTRLRIIKLRPNCMKAAIMTGAFAGKVVVIPRVTLISKNSGFPFELRRKQFPVQVAFGMTINKSQGQYIQHLRLFLPEPLFSHGQFYVAKSRVTSRANIKILVDNPPM